MDKRKEFWIMPMGFSKWSPDRQKAWVSQYITDIFNKTYRKAQHYTNMLYNFHLIGKTGNSYERMVKPLTDNYLALLQNVALQQIGKLSTALNIQRIVIGT